MAWNAYRDPGAINGLSRQERIGIAVLNGDLDVVRAVVPLARRFVPPEIHLTHDEIDTLFAAMPSLAECLDVVLGTEHPLTVSAEAALEKHPEFTVEVWRAVSQLSEATLTTIQRAAGEPS